MSVPGRSNVLSMFGDKSNFSAYLVVSGHWKVAVLMPCLIERYDLRTGSYFFLSSINKNRSFFIKETRDHKEDKATSPNKKTRNVPKYQANTLANTSGCQETDAALPAPSKKRKANTISVASSASRSYHIRLILASWVLIL
ncbi:hypothetical protein F8M41_019789 [Gigaspora margarita]|uniref:Uncharacterized protein n=1 Tax=Gigaspora margarita TaxID=4874 RepID=A0A8H4AJI5_GIGMA|nr:hypothetical protein F8M41_019789 [Gigaspora margarita]